MGNQFTMIQDEFTALPISHTHKYHLRHRRDGLCTHCSRPLSPRSKCCCEKHLAEKQAQHKKDPLKYAAWHAVAAAIRSGELIREKCEIDGCENMGEAHHSDYSRPLEVQWMCPKHHAEQHGRRIVLRTRQVSCCTREWHKNYMREWRRKRRDSGLSAIYPRTQAEPAGAVVAIVIAPLPIP